MSDQCKCRIFTSDKGRNQLKKEIQRFKKEEFIYAALPFGAWTAIPDPQRIIVSDEKHMNKSRLSKYRVNSKLHSKYLIGRDKIIWGSGNFTETSIFNKHETYEIVHKSCHREKYDKLFKHFKSLWQRSTETNFERNIEVHN